MNNRRLLRTRVSSLAITWAAFVTAIGAVGQVEAQDSAPEQPAVLTRIAEVLALSIDDAQQARRVRIDGRFTYYDPPFGAGYIKDGASPGITVRFAQGIKLEHGWVRVDGTTRARAGAVTLLVTRITQLRRRSPRGECFDLHRGGPVEAELQVRELHRDDHAATLWCMLPHETDQRTISVHTRAFGAKELPAIGSMLRIRGFHAPLVAAEDALAVFAQTLDHIDILHAAPQPKRPITVRSLRDLSDAPAGARFRIDGQVTRIQDGAVVLEHRGGGALIYARSASTLAMGAMVTVVGERARDGTTTAHAIHEHAVVAFRQARALRADEVSSRHVHTRVTVAGTITTQQELPDGRVVLTLEDHGTVFHVVAPRAVAAEFDSIREREATARGVVLQEPPGSLAAFSIALHGIDDLNLKERPWYAQTQTFSLLIVALLVVLIGVLALRVFQSRARAQTKSLGDAMARIDSIYESLDEGVLAIDRQGVVVTTTPRAREILRVADASPLTRTSYPDVLTQHAADPVALRLRLGALLEQPHVRDEITFETVHPSRVIGLRASPVHDDDDEIIGRIFVVRDETEKRQLETNLQQAQRMEAIGTLTGGIAHDFNNLLTAISGSLSLLRSSPEQSAAEFDEHLQRAQHASERAAELVQQLLGFARRAELDLQPHSLNATLRGVVGLLRDALDENIELTCELQPHLPGVRMDPDRFERVIWSLCLNARDAMPEGGTLTIATSTSARVSTGKTEVVLTIRDTGSGMSKAVRAQAFQPFFTTKAADRRSGLGLATSYGMVRQHGGRIECDSALGEGTVVRVYLPCAQTDSVFPIRSETTSAAGEGGHVLVVDDESLVRAVAEGILRLHGFQVSSAESGSEALAMVEQYGVAFDAIVLDVKMPGMSGREVLQTLRKSGCTTPVILCSGYLGDLGGSGAVIKPDRELQKPYRPHELLSAVRHVIVKSAP